MFSQYEIPNSDEMINFGIGQPSLMLLEKCKPLIKIGMNYSQNISDPALLQYGHIQGYPQFRYDLSKFLENKYEKIVNSSNLMITNGVTEALSLILSLYSKNKIILYVEDPTYFLALNIFNDLQLDIRTIPMTDGQIDLDYLHKCCCSNIGIKQILYIIPTFQNPTGQTLSHEARHRLGKIADDFDLLVISDEVYQLLYFDKKPPPPLCYYSNNIVSLGSFSKILAPGIRLGWIHTHNSMLMDKLIKCGHMDSSGGKSPLVQSIVHGIILSSEFEQYLENTRKYLSMNCIEMCDALHKNLGDYIEFVKPDGGYFIWAKLNKKITLKHLERNGVKTHFGHKFSDNYDNYIRLSFSYYTIFDILRGIERLKLAFEDTKINIAVLGYRGRLGSRIVEMLKTHEKCNFIEGIDRDFKMEHGKKYDAIIDVSHKDATPLLIDHLNSKKIFVPLLVGTTGFEDISKIKNYIDIYRGNICNNFSMGIPHIIDFIYQFNEPKWKVHIAEYHHINKKDSPSGTALLLQKCIMQPTTITSHRIGDIIGTHEITFSTPFESITITHDVKDRNVFAIGAINMCMNLVDTYV